MNWTLQKAIVTKLAAYGATSGYTVVDNAHATSLPFVRIGFGSRTEVGSVNSLAYEETVQIDVFTDGDSGHTAKAMADNITAALRDAVLDTTSDGYTTLGTPDILFQTTLDETDPGTGEQTRQVSTEYRFFTHKS